MTVQVDQVEKVKILTDGTVKEINKRFIDLCARMKCSITVNGVGRRKDNRMLYVENTVRSVDIDDKFYSSIGNLCERLKLRYDTRVDDKWTIFKFEHV